MVDDGKVVETGERGSGAFLDSMMFEKLQKLLFPFFFFPFFFFSPFILFLFFFFLFFIYLFYFIFQRWKIERIA